MDSRLNYVYVFWIGEGENAQLSSSYKRIASVGRIMTPRSPGRTAFESTEDSDEEGTQLGDDSRIPFYPGTRDSSNNYVRICFLTFWNCEC